MNYRDIILSDKCRYLFQVGSHRIRNTPLAPQIHLSFQHHAHRDNVTAPNGRPNLRSRLHFSHSRGGPRSLRGHVLALGGGVNMKHSRTSTCNERSVC